MQPAHHDRLRAAGVEASSLDALEWDLVTDPMPSWWHRDGNALYLAGGAWLPVPGKGAAICHEGETRLIVMSFGRVGGV